MKTIANLAQNKNHTGRLIKRSSLLLAYVSSWFIRHNLLVQIFKLIIILCTC